MSTSTTKWLLACLLLIAVFSDAARSPQQRREQQQQRGSPYIISPPDVGDGSDDNNERPAKDLGERSFTLRHIYHHGGQRYPVLHRYLDVHPDDELRVSSDDGESYEPAPISLRVKASSLNIQRLIKRKPADIDHLLAYAVMNGEAAVLPATAWTVDEVVGPNITDRESVLSFARMAANAYVLEDNQGDWIPVGSGFNYTDDFGWESDGLRGHIFADEKNSTIVIALKGTSPAVFDGTDTTGNDKLNDNLFGSCCCGQGGQWTWKQVCSCMTSTYECNATCLVTSLREKSHYYWAARDLYHNVTARYPHSTVWLAGHSLGGVVTSMLGLTYGIPTVTFEAFPDALGASRLGLPTPPGYRVGAHQARGAQLGIHHFGHTADPIFMGTCNAASSFCTIAGYAFQGLCHTGQTCTYDTIGDLGWRVGIGTHKISNVIKDVLEKYDTVPGCETDVECTDCALWKFFESNGSEPVTSTRSSSSSSSSSSTRTRTETCKTPGWWGCLDESTTASMTTTTSSSRTTTTSSCKTPGWFGCQDETTTTTTTTSSSAKAGRKSSAVPARTTAITTPVASITSTNNHPPPARTSPASTCKRPGWFGCRDEHLTATTSITRTKSSSQLGSESSAPDPTGAPVPPTPSASHLPTTRRKTCMQRYWYGGCAAWSQDEAEDRRHEGDL